MAEIPAGDVKRLREMTGAGMMDCKRALQDTGGDIEAAVDLLRKKGIAKAQSKAGRTASEGTIESYVHKVGGVARTGALVEVNCESDFVAKTDDFRELARELALQVAGAKPHYVRREEIPAAVVEREKAVYADQVKDKPANIVEKILAGKLEAFYEQVCLVDQVYIRDTAHKKKVSELIHEAAAKVGENISVARFARFEVGEAPGNGATPDAG